MSKVKPWITTEEGGTKVYLERVYDVDGVEKTPWSALQLKFIAQDGSEELVRYTSEREQ